MAHLRKVAHQAEAYAPPSIYFYGYALRAIFKSKTATLRGYRSTHRDVLSGLMAQQYSPYGD